MPTLSCDGCRGLCCGPVPITAKELLGIKKTVKAMSTQRRTNLANQPRHRGTCIFYDLDQDRCGIYFARPEICRVFGHYRNLVCFRQPQVAAQTEWQSRERHVATLSLDITWRDLL